MAVKIRIPTALKTVTGGLDCVEVDAANVSEAIEGVEKAYPGLKAKIYDETGKLRRFVNVYVNGEDIRFLDGLDTSVPADGEISILPSIAGG